MTYAWARREPMHDLDPDLTTIQALDVARWFLGTSTLMVAAAARQAGVVQAGWKRSETFASPGRASNGEDRLE
jgi:hypothetical protein